MNSGAFENPHPSTLNPQPSTLNPFYSRLKWLDSGKQLGQPTSGVAVANVSQVFLLDMGLNEIATEHHVIRVNILTSTCASQRVSPAIVIFFNDLGRVQNYKSVGFDIDNLRRDIPCERFAGSNRRIAAIDFGLRCLHARVSVRLWGGLDRIQSYEPKPIFNRSVVTRGLSGRRIARCEGCRCFFDSNRNNIVQF